MLTESDLQTATWLASIASGQCVVIRGHVGEHRLEGIKAILPLGVFQWTPLELPQGEALDPEFFASIMPALLGEVPKKVYVMPLVASSIQIDALAEVRVNQPWLQWVAVVPDPEIDPILPDGILLFDAKTRVFTNEERIPAPIQSWAEKILAGMRSEEEKKHTMGLEGPKILATINAISAGEYQGLSSILGPFDAKYVSQLVTIAVEIAGVEGVDPDTITAEIEESTTIEATITHDALLCDPCGVPLPEKQLSQNTKMANLNLVHRPQVFEQGKALPMYPPGDPAGRYAREMDAVRRDPEIHGALLEILQELPCMSDGGQPRACVEGCNDPIQKWACLRDNAWGNGMPSAIVDHWIEVFAQLVARAGRKAREAYNSFINIAFQASAANTTFSVANFAEMVQRNTIPTPQAPTISPTRPLKIAPQPSDTLRFPLPVAIPKTGCLPQPMRTQKLPAVVESRAQKLSARLDVLVDRIEQLKGRLQANGSRSPTPQSANDPLLGPSNSSSVEAEDLGDADLSLDALEKRVARLAHGR